MMFMKRMIAMMAVVFSVAMFAACSDDDEGDGGNGGNVAATGVTLDQPTLTLAPGETAALVATVTPENATDKSVTWTSSNEAVATVDSTGLVTAVAVGEDAVITATTTSGGFTATCTVTVALPELHVGDIYYSDGTYSAASALDESKTPIGVVFHVFEEGATVDDPSLATLFPNGLHGLVMSLDEFPGATLSKYFAQYANETVTDRNYYQFMLSFFAGDYENTTQDQAAMVGYNNTLIMQAFNEYALVGNIIYTDPYYWEEGMEQSGPKDFPVQFNLIDSVANYNERVAVPESASSWYIPSHAELNQIVLNVETITASLEALDLDGLTMTGYDYSKYWTSTNLESITEQMWTPDGMQDVVSYNTYFSVYNFNYQQFETTGSATAANAGANNVRYVLAF